MRITFITVILSLFCLVAQAAPLTNYSFGHASADLFVSFPYTEAMDNSGNNIASEAYGANIGSEFGVTIGLGSVFAFRFKQDQNIAPIGNRSSSTNFKYAKNCYDLMLGFQSDKRPLFFAIYLGMINYQFGVPKLPVENGAMDSYSGNEFNYGALVEYQIFNDISANFQLGFSWLGPEAEAGVSYNLSKNMDLNLGVDYFILHGNDVFVKSYNANLFKIDTVTPKMGVTVKF